MTVKELMARFENIADAEARWVAMSVYADVAGESVSVGGSPTIQKTMTLTPTRQNTTPAKRVVGCAPTVTPTGKMTWDWRTAGLVGKIIYNKDTGCRFKVMAPVKNGGLTFVGMRDGFTQKYDMRFVTSRTAHDTIYNGGVPKPSSPGKWIVEESGISLGRHLHARGLLNY